MVSKKVQRPLVWSGDLRYQVPGCAIKGSFSWPDLAVFGGTRSFLRREDFFFLTLFSFFVLLRGVLFPSLPCIDLSARRSVERQQGVRVRLVYRYLYCSLANRNNIVMYRKVRRVKPKMIRWTGITRRCHFETKEYVSGGTRTEEQQQQKERRK